MISTDQVKELRDKTGISVMQCKRALEDAKGDMDKALQILKVKGAEIASKKSDRALHSGVVASYVHSNGALGALVILTCETDFVARNEEFKALAHDIAMHVTAMNPQFVSQKDITKKNTEQAHELFEKEVRESGKPIEIQKKILEGKLATHFKERTLLDQSFIKDPNQTIEDLLTGAVQKFGERIEIERFTRLQV
ncbi:MAG: elongation factor Ts [bacterium]|nr:elongation factor Ts [bacterium]